MIGHIRKLALGIVVRSRALPDNLILELPWAKHRIQQHLEVMARGRVAVEVEAAGGLEDSVQLDQPHGHHGEVGRQGVLAEEPHHRIEHERRVLIARGPLDLLDRHTRHGVVPLPGVAEGILLRGDGLAGGRAEERVVVGVRVEGRVEVDEIDVLVRECPQNVEIVAVIEVIHALPPEPEPGARGSRSGGACRVPQGGSGPPAQRPWLWRGMAGRSPPHGDGSGRRGRRPLTPSDTAPARPSRWRRRGGGRSPARRGSPRASGPPAR